MSSSQSIDTLRVGHRYVLINYGERNEFELMEIHNRRDYMVKDLNTLEVFNMRILTEYGKGSDYDLFEIED